jgi:hypothetical protein
VQNGNITAFPLRVKNCTAPELREYLDNHDVVFDAEEDNEVFAGAYLLDDSGALCRVLAINRDAGMVTVSQTSASEQPTKYKDMTIDDCIEGINRLS